MKKLLSQAFFLILVVPLFANATSCPTNNVVVDAPLFQWTEHPAANGEPAYFSGTLIMDEVTLTLNNGETLTTRAYAQAGDTPSVPGPTIVMAPGKKYVLKFENRLAYEPLSTAHNAFKDPNVTNLHTHGLHTTGDTPGDDATRIFEGRTGGDYVFDITSDHMGGTFWIHAHHHGSTYLQISSGAFGMLLIDDASDGIPANVAAMEERLLTMAYLDPSVAGTGGDMLVSGTLNPGWNVNGTVDGNICMPANTWQHWRMLVAAADVKAKDVTVGSQCEVALMARDGVWRTMVPKNLSNNTLSLTGGSRADIAVRCSGDSTLTVGNTVVANIYADANLPADNTAHPYAADGTSQWASFRPGYLRDLRDPALAIEGTSVTNFETVNMGARTINGSKFDINEPTFITQADGVQEWNVKGATNHPFHLHVFHFQAQTDCGEYEAGEFYDTIAAACNVRFDLNPQTSTVFDGKTIFHCHLLDHEDQGAMGYMVVQPAPGTIPAPTYPVSAGFSEKYELDGGEPPTVPADPSGLFANAVSSSQINLSWTDNATDEDSYQVEQSLDGVNFSVIDVLGADSTSYSDTGLSASTSYFYQVNAINAAGASGYTNIASAITNAGGGGTATSVEVGTITVSTSSVGGGQKIGVADIVVIDDLGNPVAGAVVSGEFTGTITETISASPATDANGQTSISTTGAAKGKVNLTFCVTDIVDTNGVLSSFSGSVCGSL